MNLKEWAITQGVHPQTVGGVGVVCALPRHDVPVPGLRRARASLRRGQTTAYPSGTTQASNLQCRCRKHHLLKMFGGWRDNRLPDGTMVWTSARGQTYNTCPGSKLLFPSLCRPTAPVAELDAPKTAPNRRVAMPNRRHTRAENRARAIAAERRLNDPFVAERNRPPPF